MTLNKVLNPYNANHCDSQKPNYTTAMHRIALFLSVFICVSLQAADRPVATYSIVAFDPATGDLGVAVQSKFFGVGSVVPWARAGIGAVATQSYANTTYGPQGLKLMAAGQAPENVLKKLTETDPARDLRQVGMVDAQGRAASFTGKRCTPWAGHKTGDHYAAQGNLLAGEAVVTDMATAFEKARKQPNSQLADWLIAAVTAAEAAGGDKRGRQSAALLVVRDKGGYAGLNDRFIDIRVDDHKTPVKELARLLELHKQFYPRAHRNKPVRQSAD